MQAKHWLPYAAGLVNLALVALIGHATVKFGLETWLPSDEQTETVGWAEARSPTNKPAPPPGPDLSALQQSHLFGQAESKPVDAPAAPLDAPETPLKLILQGTFATEAQNSAKAIIAAPDGESKLYRAGDTLPSGARLQAIYPDRVILLRNSRYETLSLPKDSAPGTSPPPALPPPAAAATGPDSRKLADYRQQILAKPSSMTDFLRLRPAESNGQLTGYTLMPGKNPQVMAEFGLQSGDIVTSVNGTKLDSPVKGLSVMQQLASARRVDLEILRNGQPMRLSFSLE